LNHRHEPLDAGGPDAADLAERFRRLAEKNGRTVQQEIRAALREHVERANGLLTNAP
jgi:hypothetical protein